MRLIPMRNIRASDNSEIHLECLPPLFLDRLRLLFLNQNKCCGYSKRTISMRWFLSAPETHV